MRPIRPVRIGRFNTEWATDGWYRQGVPVNDSLILTLKCGHIETVPQHPVKLRKLVHCPMCVRLWTERMAADAHSKQQQRKRIRQHEEIEDMAKKLVKKKKVSTASGEDRRGRKVFAFVKPAKNIDDDTIMGIVHNAIKKVKQGSVAEVTTAAIKGGLTDVTGQDPMVQTGVMLNRLKAMGSVKKIEAEGKAKPTAAKAGKKLRFKLKKTA